MAVSLQRFYEAVRKFLVESELETAQSLRGYSDEEIASAERFWGIKFPKAYRLFLSFFGKSSNLLEDQNCGIDVLPLAQELRQEIAGRNQLKLQAWFPFTERQWYSFYSFKCDAVDKDNPEILLVVEGDEGAELYHYPSFTDWLLTTIENYLRVLESLKKVGATERIARFAKLKQTF